MSSASAPGPRPRKKPNAGKASVMFARQGQDSALDEEPPPMGPQPSAISDRNISQSRPAPEPCGCCAPVATIFNDLFGLTDGSTGGRYGAKQELDPLRAMQNFLDAPEEAKCGVQAYVKSTAKERTPDWENQDNFACHVLDPVGNDGTRFFFGVFDGHGRFGHHVSRIINRRLASHLAASSQVYANVEAAFQEAMRRVDADVYANLSEDCEYSGSTCICCLVDWTSRMLHTSCVGDSRAILGRQRDDGRWEAIQLSEDQRPDLPEECARIQNAGGVVSPVMDDGVPVGPARVWDDKSLTKPGLACSRSIGDGAARLLGVTPEPVVKSRKIEPQDKFLLICSDGVWDAVKNEDAVDELRSRLQKVNAKEASAGDDAMTALTEIVRNVEGGALTDDTTMLWVILQK